MTQESRQADAPLGVTRDQAMRDIPNAGIYAGLAELRAWRERGLAGHDADVDLICGLYAAMYSAISNLRRCPPQP